MRLYLTVVLVVCCLSPLPASAQEEDDFVIIEAVRSEIDDIFESYMSSGGGVARMEAAIDGVARFVAIGEDAVPYLINELEQERIGTYDFCSYALGLIGGVDAVASLRSMVERAENQPGDAAKSVKTYAIWGLALTGDASALDLVFTGRHRVAATSLHRSTSLVESAAILTSPDSVDYLIKWMEMLVDDPERWRERRMIMQGLGRIAQPAAIPILVHTLLEGIENDRRYAATALIGLDSPESVAALISVLDDESYAIRRTASRALADIGAPAAREKAVEVLASEEDVFVRAALYRLLEEIGGPDALQLLRSYSGREDARDRRFLLAAIARLRDPAARPFLQRALLDRDNGVALEAAMQLRRQGDDAALDTLVDAIPQMRLQIAHSTATLLAEARHMPAAGAIADRLSILLDLSAPDRSQMLALERLTDAAVTLRHLPTLDLLEQALEREISREMRSVLELRREQLGWVKHNGKKLRRWLEASASDDAAQRRFAFLRIGELASAAAARELAKAFDDAELADRFAIVNGLGNGPADIAAPILRRVLLDEEFDKLALSQLRDAAGWSARRLGGQAMLELLVEAARHVDGRNARLMVYVAQMDAQRAIPLFESLRKPRFRSLGPERGEEQFRLDWIQRRLERGRSVDEYDLPPHKLRVR